MSAVYINSDPKTRAVDKISTKVCGVLWQLYYHMDKENICDKRKLQARMHWIKDKRSWRKYWKELVEQGVIIYLDRNTFMVSPHQCYHEGVSSSVLIEKWNKLKGEYNEH